MRSRTPSLLRFIIPLYFLQWNLIASHTCIEQNTITLNNIIEYLCGEWVQGLTVFWVRGGYQTDP